MPPAIKQQYEGVHDAIEGTTITKAYMIQHLGRLNAIAEVPPTPTPANLSDFLHAPPALPEYELMPQLEPLLVYEPLPEYEHMFATLPALEPIVLEVLVIEISLFDSPILASDSSKSNPFEETSTSAS